ncbi:MAG: hypothetical protein U0270_35120 [Labilithrix sp.]
MPPSASSKAPARWATAPVNAPRSWPKSSLSMSEYVTAPQSTTRNGFAARGEAPAIARARTSLPVPVSPSRRTVASVGAIRSSTPKMVRIGRLWPMAAPKLVFSLGRRSTFWAAGRNAISTPPTLSTLPACTIASRIRVPSILVPFVDSRSRTWSPSGARMISQWWRETVSSERTRSLSLAVPMRK